MYLEHWRKGFGGYRITYLIGQKEIYTDYKYAIQTQIEQQCHL